MAIKDEIVAFARRYATMAVRRAAVPAALGLAAAVFLLFAVTSLFAALFFWFAPAYGPLAASLIVTAVALVLALLVLLPFAFKRRPTPPPPDATLTQFVSLEARSTPGHAPRQLILTAVLLALAIGLTARGSSDGNRK